MTTTFAHRLALAAVVVLAAGCQQFPIFEQQPTAAPQPAAPQITEDMLRERAKELLASGVKQYDAGDYDNAVKSLQASLDHGVLSKVEQSRARKYLAFSHCVAGRELLCRDEFRKAFEINPEFALSTAEDGHPIWGPVYRNVRTQLITEREAAVRKPLIPLGKAEQMLSDGLVKYDAGDYPAAHRLLEAAVREGLRDRADKVRAMKHAAFSLCLESRFPQCKAAFVAIYDVDPSFDLSPAEAGHPSWTKTFAAAKAQAKKALRDKELREAKEKGKGAPPAASVPKR